MVDIKFPHYFSDEPPKKINYASKGGGSEFKLPERERAKHQERLNKKFEEAWELADQGAVSIQERGGVYIEFSSQKGYELPTYLLDNSREKIRLLSRRDVGEGEEKTTISVSMMCSLSRLS